jgi:hypothetical protein
MRTRTLIALAVLGLAAALSGLALAAGSSLVSTPRIGSNVLVPAEKAAAMTNRMPSAATDATASAAAAAATPAFTPAPIPAKILGSDAPVPVPGSVFAETNGWIVSNGYNLVAVYAGSAADDPTQGRVVIVRQDMRSGAQTVQIIDAGTTGALSIAADASTGTTALTGGLKLATSNATTVTLNLGTNTISAH